MIIATIVCKDGTNRVLKYPKGISLRKKKINGVQVTETPQEWVNSLGQDLEMNNFESASLEKL